MAIADYLNELINQKSQLAKNISKMGVTADESEKFNTLVPKILQIESGSDGGGTSGTTEIEVLDCSNMASSSEVLSGYSDVVKVSNDGSYSSFETLSDYVYNTISAVYTNSTAGISLKAGTSSCGFYFNSVIETTSSRVLLKLIYFVSTWINPSIVLNFIDSSKDIETAIVENDYVLSKTITLASSLNNANFYSDLELAVGKYYLFVSVPSTTGGNDAVLSSIDLLCL